jgi:hypothetical protein
MEDLRDLETDERIILKGILVKKVCGYGLDICGSRYKPVAGSCEHGNELSGSIKGGKLPDELYYC